MRLARRATSTSSPTPPTQQKYRPVPVSCGAGDPPASGGATTPKSTWRTLPLPETNFRQAARASPTLRSCSARAKSLPLPCGTTSTGSCRLASCGKWRCTVPSPPRTRIASASPGFAGNSSCQRASEQRANGCKCLVEEPNPRMAATRISPPEINKLWPKGVGADLFGPASGSWSGQRVPGKSAAVGIWDVAWNCLIGAQVAGWRP